MLRITERHFQKQLQARIGYGHKRLPSGITDITTPTKHIEIKNWRQWKFALGQLLAYDYYDKKDRLEVHMFGDYPEKNKEIARAVFDSYNIHVHDITTEQFQGHRLQKCSNLQEQEPA